jgi:hypothetical protein
MFQRGTRHTRSRLQRGTAASREAAGHAPGRASDWVMKDKGRKIRPVGLQTVGDLKQRDQTDGRRWYMMQGWAEMERN